MFTFHELLFGKADKPDFLALNVSHTLEFILLVYVAGAVTGWMWLQAVLWGILFHMVFDLMYLYRQGRLFRRALSIIEYVIRWRRMKRQGLRPELPYHSVLKAMSVIPGSSNDSEV